ncbi:hypothetical protein G6F62_014667 [Rhizopus arrhizus]|nr:hypothetical protein G6F62_014667 [Rhizopus arrhizus]
MAASCGRTAISAAPCPARPAPSTHNRSRRCSPAPSACRPFADVLYSKEKTEFTSGSSALWWGTKSVMGGFYDQGIGKVVNLQRAFAPEEIGPGHYNNILNSDESRAYQVTLGGKGMVGD